jgi:hypothetical protein
MHPGVARHVATLNERILEPVVKTMGQNFRWHVLPLAEAQQCPAPQPQPRRLLVAARKERQMQRDRARFTQRGVMQLRHIMQRKARDGGRGEA